jgi:hypothetical protein
LQRTFISITKPLVDYLPFLCYKKPWWKKNRRPRDRYAKVSIAFSAFSVWNDYYNIYWNIKWNWIVSKTNFMNRIWCSLSWGYFFRDVKISNFPTLVDQIAIGLFPTAYFQSSYFFFFFLLIRFEPMSIQLVFSDFDLD